LNTGKCGDCPDGYGFNDELNQCSLMAIRTCVNGRRYNPETDTCVCPDSTPYYTGSKCISCLLPKFFNEDTRQCEECPEGKKYNSIT